MGGVSSIQVYFGFLDFFLTLKNPLRRSSGKRVTLDIFPV